METVTEVATAERYKRFELLYHRYNTLETKTHMLSPCHPLKKLKTDTFKELISTGLINPKHIQIYEDIKLFNELFKNSITN